MGHKKVFLHWNFTTQTASVGRTAGQSICLFETGRSTAKDMYKKRPLLPQGTKGEQGRNPFKGML